MRHYCVVLAGILGAGVGHAACGQGIDPPTRVGRVSDMQGTVSLFTAGATDWTPASLNYPLTSGDALWADSGARAEVHLGSSAVRIAPQTSLVFGEVSDTVTQVRVDEGSIDVHVRYLSTGEIYEIDTPAGVVSLLDEGHYRIDVTPDGRRATVTVRNGSADLSMGDRDYPVRAGTSATIIAADRPPITGAAIAQDDWERWADGRDQREDAVQSTRYVSRDMVGYEDLDDYGDWQADPSYGSVWYPRSIPAGWTPYHYGHWESVQPWGWTWIDDEPWGFAPFHYGRWASVRGRWAWVPGEAKLRPVYAPALVAFLGGQDWGGSASFGSGGGVGWVPLAPGEPYVPAYRASAAYVSRLNINLGPIHIGVNLGRPDINQIQLANRSVPGAVTAVPRDVFVRSRPVAGAAVLIRPADAGAIRPSATPIAAGQPVAPPARGQMPIRGRSGGQTPHPPGLAAAQVTPPPPPQFRGGPRPSGQEPVRPGPPTVQPIQTPVAPVSPPIQDRGGRPPRPAGQPAPPTPVATAPTTVTPPTAPPPPPTPPSPDRGRGRQVQPTPAPPAPPTPGQPQGGRSNPPPSANASADQLQQQWTMQRKQLIGRQAQEDADLAARQQAQLKQPPAKLSAPQVQQQQQNDKRSQDERHQKERDQLDKQFRKPN